MAKPMVYVVHGGEAENNAKILNQVKKKSHDDQRQNDFICIGSSCLPGPDSAASLTAFLINIYRKHGGSKIGRTTILNAEDGMLGLQLCLADINLQSTGEFDAPISDVLTEMNHVVERKLEKNEKKEVLESGIPDSLAKDEKKVFEKYQTFLESSFYVDLYDLLNFYKDQCSSQEKDVECLNDKSFIIFDLPVNAVEKAMFSFLCSTREVTSVDVKESALEDKEGVNLEFHSVDSSSSSPDLGEPHSHPKTPKANRSKLSPKYPKTPKANQSNLSPTQKYIRQVFLSYLDLLVNSNSSISLARVINIPDREIDHHAFTLLKRRANKSNLSMYQLAISLVMKIRLGGKGYAPDQNDPLLPYIKGLSQFVDYLQDLHTILEDEPDVRLACQQVVKVLKKTILKSKESLSRKPAVEQMAAKVQEDIKAAYEDIQNSTSQPSKGGSRVGSQTSRVLQTVLDQHVINTSEASDMGVLTDVFLTQGTPLRFPSLLSQFRSPEPETSVEKIQPLAERLSKHIINQQIVPRNKSFMSWVAPSMNGHVPVAERIEYVLPSKTLVCPASGKKIYTAFSKEEKENVPSQVLSTNENLESKDVRQDKAKEVKEKGGGAKRKRTEKKAAIIPKKKCCKKLLPQIKGQTTLNFFVRK